MVNLTYNFSTVVPEPINIIDYCGQYSNGVFMLCVVVLLSVVIKHLFIRTRENYRKANKPEWVLIYDYALPILEYVMFIGCAVIAYLMYPR